MKIKYRQNINLFPEEICFPKKYNAIYMTIMGDDIFLKMSFLCSFSFFLFGGFAGKIIIFSDDARKSFDYFSQKDEERKIIDRIEFISFCPKEVKSPYEIRSYIYKVYDFSKYNNVMYIDVDTLALKNINELFFFEDDYCICATENVPLSDKWFAWDFDNEDKKMISSLKGINSGFFIVSSRKIYDFLCEWNKKYLDLFEKYSTKIDQPSLNYILYKNVIKPKIVNDIVGVPFRGTGLTPQNDYLINHYLGSDRGFSFEVMEKDFLNRIVHENKI